MNLIKSRFIFLAFYGLMFFLPVVLFAQVVTCAPGTICNPLARSGINTVQGFIEVLLKGVIKIGMPVIALALIYCGFLFVAAVGNSEKIKKARESLVYTLIGAAILLGSWAIAILISETVRGLS